MANTCVPSFLIFIQIALLLVNKHFTINDYWLTRTYTFLFQVYDGGMDGLKLHPGSGFTDEITPELTLTANNGRMLVKFVTDSAEESAGFSALYSADCPPLEAGAGAIGSGLETTFGSVAEFSCPLGQVFATGVSEIR